LVPDLKHLTAFSMMLQQMQLVNLQQMPLVTL
jgi:hypothetical protein